MSFIPLPGDFMKAEDLKTEDYSEDFLKSRLKSSWRFHAFESTAWIFPLPWVFDGFHQDWTFMKRTLLQKDFNQSWERVENVCQAAWVTWCFSYPWVKRSSPAPPRGHCWRQSRWCSDEPNLCQFVKPRTSYITKIDLHWVCNCEGTKVDYSEVFGSL